MNKTSIELERDTNHIKGYGRMSMLSEDRDEVLNRVVEWSKLMPDCKIYKHKIRYVEENIRKDDLYHFDGGVKSAGWKICPPQDIPRCDYVCYLDIYYQ